MYLSSQWTNYFIVPPIIISGLSPLLPILYSDERLECWRRTRWKRAFKPPPHTATLIATSDFQAELLSKLLLKGTHLRKWAVGTLSYSPASTLHPHVIYALAFSAGLNGLQIQQADRENDKRTYPYTPGSLYYTRWVCKVWRDYTCHACTIIAWKANKKRTHENSKRLRDSF